MAALVAIKEALELRHLLLALLGLLGSGILALIIDYARMLNLRRKMVRTDPLFSEAGLILDSRRVLSRGRS